MPNQNIFFSNLIVKSDLTLLLPKKYYLPNIVPLACWYPRASSCFFFFHSVIYTSVLAVFMVIIWLPDQIFHDYLLFDNSGLYFWLSCLKKMWLCDYLDTPLRGLKSSPVLRVRLFVETSSSYVYIIFPERHLNKKVNKDQSKSRHLKTHQNIQIYSNYQQDTIRQFEIWPYQVKI